MALVLLVGIVVSERGRVGGGGRGGGCGSSYHEAGWSPIDRRVRVTMRRVEGSRPAASQRRRARARAAGRISKVLRVGAPAGRQRPFRRHVRVVLDVGGRGPHRPLLRLRLLRILLGILLVAGACLGVVVRLLLVGLLVVLIRRGRLLLVLLEVLVLEVLRLLLLLLLVLLRMVLLDVDLDHFSIFPFLVPLAVSLIPVHTAGFVVLPHASGRVGCRRTGSSRFRVE